MDLIDGEFFEYFLLSFNFKQRLYIVQNEVKEEVVEGTHFYYLFEGGHLSALSEFFRFLRSLEVLCESCFLLFGSESLDVLLELVERCQ
jgi:hypothetical protein